jgi:hypothetical protein
MNGNGFNNRGIGRPPDKPENSIRFPLEDMEHIEGVDMKEIKLTQNKVALVDDQDFELLSKNKWCAGTGTRKKTYYAIAWINKKNTYMHHQIMGLPLKGFEIDHKDGNGLNNQRENLRIVTPRQNLQNIKNKKKTSQYPGVHWDKVMKHWQARIRINGPQKYLGVFKNELDAFNAYQEALNNMGLNMVGDK